MRRKLATAAGWLGVTALATLVSVGAVGLVGSGVTEQPTVSAAALDTSPPTTSVASTSQTTAASVPTSSPTAPSTSVGGSSSSVAGSGPSTTSTTPATSPTTASSTTAATTPTTTAPAATVPPPAPHSYATPGGSVTIICFGDEIQFGGAVPTLGYTAELDDTGPARVRVEFINETRRDEIRVECSGGVPVADVRVG